VPGKNLKKEKMAAEIRPTGTRKSQEKQNSHKKEKKKNKGGELSVGGVAQFWEDLCFKITKTRKRAGTSPLRRGSRRGEEKYIHRGCNTNLNEGPRRMVERKRTMKKEYRRQERRKREEPIKFN